MKKNKEKNINYVIILLVTIMLIIPVFKGSLLDTNDGKLHLLRIFGVVDSIKSGIFPPIISPSYMNSWGYGISIFYNPLTTYIPMIIGLITGSYTIAIKLFMGCSIFLAGIFMYKFTYEVTKKHQISIISAVIYMTVPYYLCDMYTRGALAEFVALTFVPLVFAGLYNLVQGDEKKHFYIAIGATCLVLTHNITTVYTAIFCLLYLIFNVKKLKDKDKIIKIIINIIFIVLISLFFTVPLMINKSATEYTIFSDYMGISSEEVNSNGLKIRNLFWGYTETGINAQIGIINILGLIISIFAIKKVDEKYKNEYMDFLTFGIIAILMSLRYFPWIIMPKLFTIIQFPWRLIGFAGFFLSFVTAIGIGTLLESKIKKKKLIKFINLPIICIVLICASLQNFTLEKDDNYTDFEYEDMRKENMVISYYQINREYMPTKAYENIESYLKNRSNNIEVLQGQCEIGNQEKNKLKIEANISDIQSNTELEMPFLYYAGYEAYIVDEIGKEDKVETYESENGFVAVKINNKSDAKLTVEYKTPISYYLAIIISSVSLIGFVIYIFMYCKSNKKEKMN